MVRDRYMSTAVPPLRTRMLPWTTPVLLPHWTTSRLSHAGHMLVTCMCRGETTTVDGESTIYM